MYKDSNLLSDFFKEALDCGDVVVMDCTDPFKLFFLVLFVMS